MAAAIWAAVRVKEFVAEKLAVWPLTVSLALIMRVRVRAVLIDPERVEFRWKLAEPKGVDFMKLKSRELAVKVLVAWKLAEPKGVERLTLELNVADGFLAAGALVTGRGIDRAGSRGRRIGLRCGGMGRGAGRNIGRGAMSSRVSAAVATEPNVTASDRRRMRCMTGPSRR